VRCKGEGCVSIKCTLKMCSPPSVNRNPAILLRVDDEREMPLSLAKTRWSECVQGKDDFRARLNKPVVRTPLSSEESPSSRDYLQKAQEIVFLAHTLLQNSEHLLEARLYMEDRFDVHTCT